MGAERAYALLALLVGLAPAGAARAQLPAAPFDAWIDAENLQVVPSRTKLWPSLGVLRYGDFVHVVRCDPSCGAAGAWAYVEPFGAIRAANLRATPRPEPAVAGGPEASFQFARVIGRSVVSRAARDERSAVVRSFDTGDEIALRPDAPVDGFFQRADGSFLRAADLRPFVPSTLAGWQDPPNRFVVAHLPTTLTRADGTTRAVQRYERFAYVATERGRVRVEEGTLPYTDVRLGQSRRRPRRIPADAKWVHVDLRQQLLTAYEGDRLVFATLISAGRSEGTTQPGFFRVERKLVFTTMKASAKEDDSYFVEGVQWVQYFHDAVAFHAAYWHDRFGTPMSHGCVNLSPADARWLFQWSPGEVPRGWRGLDPLSTGVASLYVWIDR